MATASYFGYFRVNQIKSSQSKVETIDYAVKNTQSSQLKPLIALN
jgi:hypothetical protein